MAHNEARGQFGSVNQALNLFNESETQFPTAILKYALTQNLADAQRRCAVIKGKRSCKLAAVFVNTGTQKLTNICVKPEESCVSPAWTESVAAHFFSYQKHKPIKMRTHLVGKLPVRDRFDVNLLLRSEGVVNYTAASRWFFLAVLLILGVVFTLNANADEVTYTLQVVSFPGDVGPSGSVGPVSFGGTNTNDVLTFTFQGDTSNVVPWSVTVPNPLPPPATITASGFEILTGTASFQVTDANTGMTLAQGTFLPSDRIFVSVDNSNNAMGFGSFAVDQNSPNFPGLPTYPYGMAFGIGLDTYDMKSNFTVPLSAGALVFSCIGFPQSMPINGDCSAPIPLATTAGDLFVDFSPQDHDQTGSFTAIITAPEPSSLLLLGMGLLGLMKLQKTKFLQRSPKTGQR